jgi:hypothetical protein
MRNSRRCWAIPMAALVSALPARYARAESEYPNRDAEHAPAPALFLAGRMGLYAPYGSLYSNRDFVTTRFQDLASVGPELELDFGARAFGHFVGYGYWEYAELGKGANEAWAGSRGGETSAIAQGAGLALRWMSHPEGLGFVVDAGVGYRWFRAGWTDGTSMDLSGVGELRLGLGADLAISQAVGISPMLTLSSGIFTDRTFLGQPIGSYNSAYAAAALTLAARVDIFGG